MIVFISLMFYNNNKNNNNSNNNDSNNNYNINDNNKDQLPHAFLQWFFVLQKKKTIKMKKNVKIYQYIIINTKNMTTKFVKEIKTDSDSKTIVKVK